MKGKTQFSIQCLGKTAHGSVQSETDVDHPVLESTYLLLHLVCLIHQRPVPMYFGPESTVFLIDKGHVDPLCPRIFAEQDESVSMRIRFDLVGVKSGHRVGWLLVHRVSFSHSPPHHRFVVHPIFDKACGVEAAFMTHFHGTEVGGYIVLKPSRASDDRGISH